MDAFLLAWSELSALDMICCEISWMPEASSVDIFLCLFRNLLHKSNPVIFIYSPAVCPASSPVSVSRSIFTSIGFATWAFIPASKASCTSSAKALAVIAMIGMVPAPLSPFCGWHGPRRIHSSAAYGYPSGQRHRSPALPAEILRLPVCRLSSPRIFAPYIFSSSHRISELMALSSATRKQRPVNI